MLLYENFFAELLKLGLRGKVKAVLTKYAQDPEIAKAAEELEKGVAEVEDFCKRNPDSPLCKNNKGREEYRKKLGK